MRPNLGEIKDVVAEVFGLLGSHGLDVDSPGRVVARLDSLEQGLGSIVRILTSQLGSSSIIEGLETTICPDMNLGVNEGAVILDPFEGVS